MIFFVLILLLLIFNGAEFCRQNEFNRNYIARDDTLAIKGIFVALILLSHGKGYIELSGVYDKSYIALQNHLGQMVVSMFLFYSGFGMMESIKKKQFSYIKTIPKKRFPHLLLMYDLAVLMFALMDIALGKGLTLKQFLLAICAWDGIGNSNWYIFVILALYVATFVAFLPKKFSENKFLEFLCIVVLTALTIGLVIALIKAGKDTWWYDTAILFAMGFWYSYFKDIIEKVLMKNDIVYFSALSIVILSYILAYLHRNDRFMIYSIWAMLFVALVVMISMKFSIRNEVLKFLGDHIFSIYILQRIPMIVFTHLGIAERHKYIFLIASFAVTMVMAVAFDKATGKLTALIWKPKQILKEKQ